MSDCLPSRKVQVRHLLCFYSIGQGLAMDMSFILWGSACASYESYNRDKLSVPHSAFRCIRSLVSRMCPCRHAKTSDAAVVVFLYRAVALIE